MDMRSLAFPLALLLTVTSQAQPGALDPDFNGGQPVVLGPGTQHDVVYKVIALPDTTTLFCGTTRIGGVMRAIVGHLLEDGTLDTNWGSSGYTTIPAGDASYAYDMALEQNGNIVVAGHAVVGGQSDVMVARLLPDGTLDTLFSGDGIALHAASAADDVAESVLIDGGKIIIGGSIKPQVGFVFKHSLFMRLANDGSLDVSFGTGGQTMFSVGSVTDQINDIALLSDFTIVGVGYWNTGSQDRGMMLKIDANGQPDAAFGTNGVKTAIVGAVGSKGYGVVAEGSSFVVTGYRENTDYDVFLAKFTTTGAPVTSFGTNGYTVIDNAPNDVGLGVAITGNGYVTTGTTGQFMGGARDLFTTRYDASGMVDLTFGTNGSVITSTAPGFEDGNSVAIQPDDKILVGGFGQFTNNDMVFVRYLSDAVATGTDMIATPVASLYPQPACGGTVWLRSPAALTNANARILDTRGRVLRSWSFSSAANEPVALSVDDLGAGAYWLEIVDGDARQVAPLLLSR